MTGGKKTNPIWLVAVLVVSKTRAMLKCPAYVGATPTLGIMTDHHGMATFDAHTNVIAHNVYCKIARASECESHYSSNVLSCLAMIQR
jgi:hypothetical protein